MDKNTYQNGGPSLSLPQGDALPQENLLQIVLRHRLTILFTTILCLAVAFIYLLKATPIYRSTSRLYIEQSGPKIINEYEGILTQSHNYIYTQCELIKSTPIVADAFDNAQKEKFRTFAEVDNITGFVKSRLNTSVGKQDGIISVSFDCPYPAEAAQIANEVVNSYVRYHSSRKRGTVSEVLRILQKEKVKRDEELSGKFAEMLEFTRENGVVSFDNKGGNIVFDRLSKLSSALTETQLAALNAKADFEATKSMANEPAKIKQFASASAGAGVRVSVNDRETQLLAELRQTQIELNNARYHCTEDHPSVLAIQAKIDHIKQELDEQAREFADAYIEVMRLRWVAAKEREDELQVSFDSQHEAARNLGVKTAEYSVLQSELRRLESFCEILDDRIRELNVTEDVGALNISILEVARAASSPSKPQRARVLAIALALGLMFGGGLALLRDWLDYRLRSSEEISAVLGVPILGVVPTMSEGQGIIIKRSQQVWLKLKSIVSELIRKIHSAALSTIPKRKAKPQKQTILVRAAAHRAMRTNVLCEEPKSKVKTTVVSSHGADDGKTTLEKQHIIARGQKVLLDPKSVVAEAYRTIRTAVFFGAPKDEAKTILVTSPTPSDGKTTLASNLAIAMAQAGQKTLIVDGDFRRPMQHNIFEVDDKKGLSSVLVGKHTLEEAFQPGPVRGLDILSCGQEVPNPSELLNSDAFATILKNLSQRYDRVIVDSPPVGSVADSQILAANCDVTLLVLRAGKSTRRHSQQARDSLLSVGAHILGAVVNDVPRKRGRYGYYSGYSYYSGYGYYGHYGYGYYGKREKKTG